MSERPGIKQLKSTECITCEGRVGWDRHFTYLEGGERVGPYCSRRCADADAWGPAFKMCRIRRVPMPKKKVKDV